MEQSFLKGKTASPNLGVAFDWFEKVSLESCLRRSRNGTAMVLCVLGLGTPLAADEVAPRPGDDGGAVGVVEEEASRWTLHGFLNLAWGQTDGAKYRGVDEDGTGDLRNAALQLRYQVSKSDEIVVQLAHENVGTSPTNQFREEVEFDWFFWSHEFEQGTRLRVGRVPLPIGIYNEIKDVGTALPFYRPSGNFYGEGTWTSDSVDGLVLSHTFRESKPWSVVVDGYYGSWERIETDGSTLRFGEAQIDEALGIHAWLESPSGAFRVGVGVNEFEASEGLFLAPGVTDEEQTRYFSLQAGGEKVRFNFELSRREFTGGYWQPYYAELLIRPVPRFQIGLLYDVGHLLFEIPFFATFDDQIEELFGIGLAWEARHNLVLKLEHQWVEGFGQIEDRPLNIFFDQPLDVNLLLASASYSF